MQIRSEITHEVMNWPGRPDRPLTDKDIILPENADLSLNWDLYQPSDAKELAIAREHCVQSPEGVLIDVYQAITELDLKCPSHTVEAQQRYLKGLKGELTELAVELKGAEDDHRFHKIEEITSGSTGFWLPALLVNKRLRFNDLNEERKKKCLSELGDVLWYSSRISAEAGANMSESFIAFLASTEEGELDNLYNGHQEGVIKDEAHRILDLRQIQDIALSQKLAFALKDQKTGRSITIDNAPQNLLLKILEEELTTTENEPKNNRFQEPYSQFPDIKVTVGKLIWFTAYVSSSILNADFATVIRHNLTKIMERSRQGTLFSKDDRIENTRENKTKKYNPRSPIK